MHPNFMLNEETAQELLWKDRNEKTQLLTLYIMLILYKNETEMPEFLEIKTSEICEFFSWDIETTLIHLEKLRKYGYISFYISEDEKDLAIRIFMKI